MMPDQLQQEWIILQLEERGRRSANTSGCVGGSPQVGSQSAPVTHFLWLYELLISYSALLTPLAFFFFFKEADLHPFGGGKFIQVK